MTESALRKKVVSILNGWVGGKQNSQIHKEIVAIYNEYAKAHGMALATTDYAWCDITASAAWIKAGMAKYVPISMSCGQSISKAKSMGIWIEDDSLKPPKLKIGMAVVYGWDAPKTGDAPGAKYHDHIGIVVSVGSKTFSVVEGNAGSPSMVRKLNRDIDFRYISGFICPDYKKAAKELTPKEEPKPTPVPVKDDKTDHVGAKTYTAGKKGTYKITAQAGLNLRKGPATSYGINTTMAYNTTCVCYGYHTGDWYLVAYKKNGATYEGFCLKTYLAKV